MGLLIIFIIAGFTSCFIWNRSVNKKREALESFCQMNDVQQLEIFIISMNSDERENVLNSKFLTQGKKDKFKEINKQIEDFNQAILAYHIENTINTIKEIKSYTDKLNQESNTTNIIPKTMPESEFTKRLLRSETYLVVFKNSTYRERSKSFQELLLMKEIMKLRIPKLSLDNLEKDQKLVLNPLDQESGSEPKKGKYFRNVLSLNEIKYEKD